MSDLTTLFTNIANAIRTKEGSSASIPAENFADRINALTVGGGSSEGSASNEVLTGTFTPTENTLTFSISVSKQCSNFLFIKSSETTPASAGVRECAMFFTSSTLKGGCATTGSGTAWGAMVLSTAITTAPKAEFTSSSINITNANTNGSGYFIAGVTYTYYAW